MRLRPFVPVLALAAASLTSSPLLADGDAVVARVGSHPIRTSELLRRLGAVASFQLRSFGSDPEAIRHAFLEQVIVRDVLLAEGAAAAGLTTRPDLVDKIRQAEATAMLEALRAEASVQSPVSDDDIKAYYEANITRFRSPPRLGIWRIQVATREQALDVLKRLTKDPSPRAWAELARERSLDKTTSMRGGNLGFVAPDGTSNEGVTVDHAIVAAAAKVNDGQFVPEPVPDGDRFDVLLRRQSMKAVDRSLDLERGSIRQVLVRQRAEAHARATLDALRKVHVTDEHAELLDELDLPQGRDIRIGRRPGSLAKEGRAAARPVPFETPSGLR